MSSLRSVPGLRLIVLDSGLRQPIRGETGSQLLARGQVLDVNVENLTQYALASSQAIPDGVDICNINNRLYWTCMGNPTENDGQVLSMDVDNGDIATFVPAGSIHTPKQLVIDASAQKVYVTDREGLRVFRFNLDGSDLETLICNGDWNDQKNSSDGTKWCVGIVVVPQLGKFFWTQKGFAKSGLGRIFSANIAMPPGKMASDREDVRCILDHLPECIDLDYDHNSHMLYWTDRGELPYGNTLNRAYLSDKGTLVLENGFPKHEIIAQGFSEAIGLKLDAKTQRVYISDLGGNVYSCEMDGSDKKKIYESETCAFTGIALVNGS